MRLFYSFEEFLRESKAESVLIGNFDGVHLGHRYLIESAKKISPGFVAIITYLPHSREVIQKKSIQNLCSFHEKECAFKSLCVDECVIIDESDRFYDLNTKDFLLSLNTILSFKFLFLGYDSKIGKDQLNFFEVDGTPYRFKIRQLPQMPQVNNEVISSSLIRKLIESGQFHQANKYLFYPFKFEGSIVPGFQIGRKIGFPTLNIKVTSKKHHLLSGVYLSLINLITDTHRVIAGKALINIGESPTFHNTIENFVRVEIHIPFCTLPFLDQGFVQIYPLKKIRDEKKFDSIISLQEQIVDDIHSSAFF